MARPKRRDTELIGTGAVRPFVAPRCARCQTQLCDWRGNPSWDVIGRLTFVCRDACPPGVMRRMAS